MALTQIKQSNIDSGFSPSYRNLIINGAMQIDQRGSASSAIASAGGRVYSVDRFAMGKYGGSTAGFNGQQVSVTGAGSFDKALKCTVTSAVSPSGDQANLIAYLIEGQDWERLQYKTADAKTITISFWVRSSVTGTYCVAITDSTNSIGYAAEYTINTADTFEFKTITISGYTGAGGTWNTYNNTGAAIAWGLGAAGSRLITGNTWTSTVTTPIGTSNQTNWVATSGATFYITGVQLEVGEAATSFEHRPYGTELALCQRYFQVHSDTTNIALPTAVATSGTALNLSLALPVTMRASPSLYSTLSATDKFRANTNIDRNTNNNPSLGNASGSIVNLNFDGWSGFTTGYAATVRRFTATGVLGFDAEL